MKTVCTLFLLLSIASCAVPAQRYSDTEENSVDASVVDASQNVSVIQPSLQNICEDNQSKALNSLEELNPKTNEQYGYVILMRHGHAPNNTNAAQGDVDLRNCKERRRHSRHTRQVTKMGSLIERYNANFIAVYSSEACRARETANAMGLGGNVVKRALNPRSIRRGSPDKAVAFINSLDPGPSDVYLIVTHSDIIPGVVAEYGVPREPSKIGEAEAFILRRVEGTYQCQATITPQ